MLEAAGEGDRATVQTYLAGLGIWREGPSVVGSTRVGCPLKPALRPMAGPLGMDQGAGHCRNASVTPQRHPRARASPFGPKRGRPDGGRGPPGGWGEQRPQRGPKATKTPGPSYRGRHIAPVGIRPRAWGRPLPRLGSSMAVPARSAQRAADRYRAPGSGESAAKVAGPARGSGAVLPRAVRWGAAHHTRPARFTRGHSHPCAVLRRCYGPLPSIPAAAPTR
jgi:hypothetical protein